MLCDYEPRKHMNYSLQLGFYSYNVNFTFCRCFSIAFSEW